jgi:hypothetical protein
MFAATSQTTILRAVRKTRSLASTPRARGLDAARARDEPEAETVRRCVGSRLDRRVIARRAWAL